MRSLIMSVLLAMIAISSHGQKYPERKFIRSGDKAYDKGEYPAAGILYQRALQKEPHSFPATFGLGDAQYKQQRYEEAAKIFNAIASDSANVQYAPHSLYNLGNSLMKSKQYEQAVEAYKASLRLDPTDREAKFNLAYAQKMLEQQKNKQDNKNDKNKDKDKDKDKDQNQNDKQDQNNNQDQNDKQDQTGQDMNRQEAQRMLEAVQMSEDKARDDAEKRRAAMAHPSMNNW